MKEIQVLFKGPMVRAILAGQKTVTRRPSGIPEQGPNKGPLYEVVPSLLPNRGDLFDARYRMDNPQAFRCDLGAPGDTLWVRETWQSRASAAHPNGREVLYAADYPTGIPPGAGDDWRWRPSIHMPREACRLLLEVVSVRAERLGAIDDEDALREGILAWPSGTERPRYAPANHEGDGPLWARWSCPFSPRAAFARLWSGIYGDASFLANPMVWRVEFKVRTATSNTPEASDAAP